MTGWLSALVVAVMLPFAAFSDRDEMGSHLDERPPNLQELKSPAYVFRIAPEIEGLAAEDVPIVPIEPSGDSGQLSTETPMYVEPKLSPAIDATAHERMYGWLTEAGAPEEWIGDLITIGWCESHGTADAVGDGGNSLGWPQLWTGWYPDAGYSVDQWQDPVVAAAVAVHVRTVRGRYGGGFGGWSCADLWGIY